MISISIWQSAVKLHKRSQRQNYLKKKKKILCYQLCQGIQRRDLVFHQLCQVSDKQEICRRINMKLLMTVMVNLHSFNLSSELCFLLEEGDRHSRQHKSKRISKNCFNVFISKKQNNKLITTVQQIAISQRLLGAVSMILNNLLRCMIIPRISKKKKSIIILGIIIQMERPLVSRGLAIT